MLAARRLDPRDGSLGPPTMRPMAHPLVDQLRFTRREWLRALDGVPEADGVKRLQPMNSIGWIVSHLAWHEQLSFLTRLQDVTPVPAANEHGVNGKPASTPSLSEALATWRAVVSAADPVLDALDTPALEAWLPRTRQPRTRTVGSTVQRVTYHYWFHIGEIVSIRQILGHAAVPEFVGDIDGEAPYRPEPLPGVRVVAEAAPVEHG
jgi:DinB family protein